MPGIQAFFDPATSTASFLVWDKATKAAAVIDALPPRSIPMTH